MGPNGTFWRRERRIGFVLAVVTVGVWLVPVVLAALSSLRPTPDVLTNPGGIVVSSLSLDNYRELWVSGFATTLVNSLFVALLATVITILVATPLGRSAGQRGDRLSQAIIRLLLLTYLVPVAFLVFPVLAMSIYLGVRNSLFVIALLTSSLTVPVGAWILEAQFGLVPVQLDEMAELDGASAIRRFWRVTLPSVWRGIIAVGALAFIVAWGEYTFSLPLLTNPGEYTVSVAIPHFLEGDVWRWDLLLAALPLSGFLPVAAATVLMWFLPWVRKQMP